MSFMTTNTTTNTSTVIWVEWNTETGTSLTSCTPATWEAWSENGQTFQNLNCNVDLIAKQVEHQRLVAEMEQKKKKEAANKAMKLLLDNLNQKQIKAFEKDQCIPIDAPSGNKYRIRIGRVKNIEALDEHGKVRHHLCVHPRDYVPDADTVLSQKLMLENCEEELLRLANTHPI